MTLSRRTTSAGLASAALLTALLAACGGEPSAGPPTPSANPDRASSPAGASPSESSAAAARIVAGRRSRVDDLAVLPEHPERRIAEWHTCLDRSCERRRYALTVTGDGFRHGHVVALPPRHSSWVLEPAGPDHFAVALNGGRRQLVDLAGRVTQVEVGDAPGPLTSREVPLRSSTAGFLAVDPHTGAAHRLSTPAGVVELVGTPGGRLRAVSFDAYSWSDDGGATWQHRALHLTPAEVPLLVPSADESVDAVLVGGDGATLFPWVRILRSADGGPWTSYPGPSVAMAYVDSPAVRADGDLQIDVEAWSDQRAGNPAPRPRGLYAGSNWSDPSAVRRGMPFDISPGRAVVDIVQVAVTDRSVTLFAQTPDQARLVASRDAGVHWRPVRAR